MMMKHLRLSLAFSLFAVLHVHGANLKGQIHFAPGVEEYRLLVKFRAESDPVLDAEGRLSLMNVQTLAKPASEGPLALRYRGALPPEGVGSAQRPPGTLGKPSSTTPFLARFAGLMELELPGADKHALKRIGEELELLDIVEYASLEPIVGPPPPGAVDIPPPTPSFTDRQGWLGDALTNGMDCRYAWTRGATGRGVRVFDIEDSWGDLDHEDFSQDSVAYGRPRFNDQYADHGIAVFGAILARHNGYGVDGCAPDATGRAYSFQNANGSQSRPQTLVMMGNDASPGDIILIEMQSGGWGGDNLGPADLQASVWDATKAATDKGVVVIGTAGNGNANLDGATYADYRARGDNGVIMVSGGNSTTRARHVGSHGACCVHVQGWGHNVATTGYGGLFNPGGDIRQRYTATFSGTSSAGAVVAGAAAALQSHALQVLGRPLAPREMRSILMATGRPHTGTSHIGPLPDLRAAILHVDSLAALSDTVVVPPAPSGLSYAVDTVVLRLDSAIGTWSASVTGTVDLWSVEPPLPDGLVLDTATGSISGTPLVVSPAADYAVTAANQGGTVSVVLRITVEAPVALRARALAFRVAGAGPHSFHLPAEALAPGAVVRLAIHDARGRTVWMRTLHPDREGISTVTWDGRGTQGSSVSPGMYVLRVAVENGGKTTHHGRRSLMLSPVP